MTPNLRTLLPALRSLIPLPALLLAHAVAAETCPPAGYSRSDLAALPQQGFVLADDGRRNTLAIALLGCTGDPDPAIRDGVAYAGLASWLRGKQLSPATVDALRAELLGQLQTADDADGFRKPFAALILAEVARSDRIEAVFTGAQREQLVQAAADYLGGVRDYRGFSAAEGWRHGVAHGSDLVLQLVLNPNVDAAQVQRMLTAVAAQVAPPGEIFYIYGEPERLARAAFYAHRRGDSSPAPWSAWLQRLVDPHPLAGWNEAWTSQAGLARRHNTLAFLQALHLAAAAAGDEQGAELAAQVMEAVRLVGG
jgi:hypothetical protein